MSDLLDRLRAELEQALDFAALPVRASGGGSPVGLSDDAKRAAANVRRLHPFFEVDLYGEVFRDPAARKRVREDLRKAGL